VGCSCQFDRHDTAPIPKPRAGISQIFGRSCGRKAATRSRPFLDTQGAPTNGRHAQRYVAAKLPIIAVTWQSLNSAQARE